MAAIMLKGKKARDQTTSRNSKEQGCRVRQWRQPKHQCHEWEEQNRCYKKLPKRLRVICCHVGFAVIVQFDNHLTQVSRILAVPSVLQVIPPKRRAQKAPSYTVIQFVDGYSV
jgi:hypothetical protein